jgi:hypothetical protein
MRSVLKELTPVRITSRTTYNDKIIDTRVRTAFESTSSVGKGTVRISIPGFPHPV